MKCSPLRLFSTYSTAIWKSLIFIVPWMPVLELPWQWVLRQSNVSPITSNAWSAIERYFSGFVIHYAQTGTGYIFILYSKGSCVLEILISQSLQSNVLCILGWNKFSLRILFLWNNSLIVVCSQMQTIALCQSMQFLERRLGESLLGMDLVTSFFSL